MVVVDVDNISKCFYDVEAVNEVSFVAKRGEIVGFLGPNGEGKTTTIRMIMGIIPYLPMLFVAAVVEHPELFWIRSAPWFSRCPSIY